MHMSDQGETNAPAYLVVTVRISNPDKFSNYAAASARLSEKFGGEYMLRGKASEVLEGNVDPDERVVVSRFPDANAARAYIASPEYRPGSFAAGRCRGGNAANGGLGHCVQ